MRTTINIEPDVLEAAKSLAHQDGISVGAAISRLARRGLRGQGSKLPTDRDDRIPTFEVADDAPLFGTEEVRQALEDE